MLGTFLPERWPQGKSPGRDDWNVRERRKRVKETMTKPFFSLSFFFFGTQASSAAEAAASRRKGMSCAVHPFPLPFPLSGFRPHVLPYEPLR